MSVTRDEVERMAGLARLELGEDEAESLLHELNGILEHMETLGEVDVAHLPGGEAAHREGPAPFREDGEAVPERLAFGPDVLAPRWREGFFVVPRLPGLEGAEGEGDPDPAAAGKDGDGGERGDRGDGGDGGDSGAEEAGP